MTKNKGHLKQRLRKTINLDEKIKNIFLIFSSKLIVFLRRCLR